MIEQVLAGDGQTEIDSVYRRALHTVNAKLTDPATVAQWKKFYTSLIAQWKELSITFVEAPDGERGKECYGWVSFKGKKIWVNVPSVVADAETGEELKTFKGHAYGVSSCAFPPTANLLFRQAMIIHLNSGTLKAERRSLYL